MSDNAKRRLKVYEVKIAFWEAGTEDDSAWPNQRYTVISPDVDRATMEAERLFNKEFGDRRYSVEEAVVASWLHDMEGALRA